MSLFGIVAAIVVLTACFAYLNAKSIHLPPTIALVLMSLVVSTVLIVIARLTPWGDAVTRQVREWVDAVHFSQVLLHGLLGFLLFAGALRVDLEGLFTHRWVIGSLATGGVLVSTAVVGVAAWLILRLIGVDMPLSYALLFGAIISPTDPISVLRIFRNAKVPRNLEATVVGESLFNDATGVVIFGIFLSIVESPGGSVWHEVLVSIVRDSLGGIALGLAIGYVAFVMLRALDSYAEEILLTVAVVIGGYALAEALHVSGPLAMVAAGILIGTRGRALAMSERTRENLDIFWELIDEFLNAVLFVFIGLEAIVLPLQPALLIAGAVLIPVTLLARLVTAGAFTAVLSRRYGFPGGAWLVVTWAGLRGGISVAMALSLAPGPQSSAIVTITYLVVVFTIVVQGLSMPRFIGAAMRPGTRAE